MNQYVVEWKDGDSTTTFAENEDQAAKYARQFKDVKPSKVRLVKRGV